LGKVWALALATPLAAASSYIHQSRRNPLASDFLSNQHNSGLRKVREHSNQFPYILDHRDKPACTSPPYYNHPNHWEIGIEATHRCNFVDKLSKYRRRGLCMESRNRPPSCKQIDHLVVTRKHFLPHSIHIDCHFRHCLSIGSIYRRGPFPLCPLQHAPVAAFPCSSAKHLME